jgi:hypothetical protein
LSDKYDDFLSKVAKMEETNKSLVEDNLSSIDPDINLPSQTNFKYYTTQDFVDSNQIQNCVCTKHFSVLHCNIRSLGANYENFAHMLDELEQRMASIKQAFS